jgi:hypothetical protein
MRETVAGIYESLIVMKEPEKILHLVWWSSIYTGKAIPVTGRGGP